MRPMRLLALLMLAGSAHAQFVPTYPGDYRGLVAGGSTSSSLLPNSLGCFGDSLVAGACSVVNVCTRVAAGIPGVSYTNAQNWAVSGHTAQQIRDRYFANYATACNGEECGSVLVQGAVNTLKTPGAVTGEVEQQALDTMLEVVDHALGRGRRVVWLAVLPYASCDEITCPVLVDAGARAREYNRLMAAACASPTRAGPRLKCVLPYTTFESSTTADYLDSQYACSDGIHLDDQAGKTGPQTLAALILSALGY